MKRRRSGPAVDAPTVLEELGALAGGSTFRFPVAGERRPRNALDVAGDLSMRTHRMDCGQAWGNLAIIVATARPTSTVEIGGLVSAVLQQVLDLLPSPAATKVKGRKLRIILHMLIANAMGSKATRRARDGTVGPHPDFRPNEHWLPTYKERAAAMGMRLMDYSMIEREVQAIVESKLGEAGSTVAARE